MRTPFVDDGGKTQNRRAGLAAFRRPQITTMSRLSALGACLLARPTEPKYEYMGTPIASSAISTGRQNWLIPRNWLNCLPGLSPKLDLAAREQWLTDQRDRLHRCLTADPFWYDLPCAAWYSWKNSVRISRGGTAIILGRRTGVLRKTQNLTEYFAALKERLKNVTIHYGDWTRLTRSAERNCKDRDGAIFFDPPYLHATGRSPRLYAHESPDVADWVKKWAVARAQTHPKLRIALCGWQAEHDMPPDWEQFKWRTNMGASERIWFSPNCIKPEEKA